MTVTCLKRLIGYELRKQETSDWSFDWNFFFEDGWGRFSESAVWQPPQVATSERRQTSAGAIISWAHSQTIHEDASSPHSVWRSRLWLLTFDPGDIGYVLRPPSARSGSLFCGFSPLGINSPISVNFQLPSADFSFLALGVVRRSANDPDPRWNAGSDPWPLTCAEPIRGRLAVTGAHWQNPHATWALIDAKKKKLQPGKHTHTHTRAHTHKHCDWLEAEAADWSLHKHTHPRL